SVEQRGVDVLAVVGDGSGQLDEGLDAAAASPLEPAPEQDLGLLVGHPEDHPQLLLEQVGTVEGVVEAGDQGQLLGLLRGKVLGVLEPRPTAVLDLGGLGLLARATDLIPDFAANLVQSGGGPAHHVEGIQADAGVGAVQLGRVDDPLGSVAADLGDVSAALFPKGVEEALYGVQAAAFSRPDHASPDLVHDHGGYLWPRRQLISSIPILVSPLTPSPPRQTPSTTGLRIRPAVCQSTRMSWLQALWEHCVASQAT